MYECAFCGLGLKGLEPEPVLFYHDDRKSGKEEFLFCSEKCAVEWMLMNEILEYKIDKEAWPDEH